MSKILALEENIQKVETTLEAKEEEEEAKN